MSPLAVSLRFLQTQPDGRLVELARNGHERAFEALVRRYRGELLVYCRRVAAGGTPPEDILQQGLLQAWRALSGGAEVRDARAWLYRIVHNVAITALRSAGDPPARLDADPGAPGVDQVVEQRMAARDALAGLAALPELQRQVMVSTALDGRTHDEIAAALGLTSGSVRGLIYRARSTLRAAAAALIPAPVIDWAVGEAGSAPAGFGGAGSAGLGALIVKGSAIVAVGAVAGTAAIVAGHHVQGGLARHSSRLSTDRPRGADSSRPGSPAGGARAGIVLASTAAPAGAARRTSADAGSQATRTPTGRRSYGSGGGSPSNGPDGGNGTAGAGSRVGSRDGSGSDGHSGGSGSGDRIKSGDHSGGSDGGGDHQSGTGTAVGSGARADSQSSGSTDGGGDGSTVGSSTGSDGSSTPTTTSTTSTTTTVPDS